MSTARDASLGLVLSGGGARGAFDADVVEAVHEAGLRPGAISGTSAGALTCAAIAFGWAPARITAPWTSLQTHHVPRPRLDLHRLVRWRPLLQPRHELLASRAGSTSETLVALVGGPGCSTCVPCGPRWSTSLGGERLSLDVTLALPAIKVETGRLAHSSKRPLPGEGRDGTANLVVDLALDNVLRGELLADVDHARTLSELGALAPAATYKQPVALVTVLPGEPIRGIGDLRDCEPEVARALVASGPRAARLRLQDAAWN